MPGRRAPGFGFLAVGALLAACATDPVFLAEGAPPSSDLDSLVLLPAHFDRSPATFLSAGAETITERVVR